MKNLITPQKKQVKETRYYTFPLCLLSLTKDPEELYKHICTYFITWHADKYASGIDEKQFELMIEDEKYDIRYDLDYYSKLEDHGISVDHVAYTAKRFHLGDSFVQDCVQNFDDLTEFYFGYIDKFGGDTMVRVRRDIVEDMATGDIQMNLFRSYCAILSYIGDKPYARVSNSIISIRSAGFKSKYVFRYYNERDMFFPAPLSISQVKTATRKLKERGFLLRLTMTKNRTYYSIRLKPEDFSTLNVSYAL